MIPRPTRKQVRRRRREALVWACAMLSLVLFVVATVTWMA